MLANALKNRDQLFWLLNSMGWLGYGVAASLGAMAYEKPPVYLGLIMATALLGFLLAVPMRMVYRSLWPRGPRAIVLGAIPLCYVLALCWTLVQNKLYFDWIKGGWTPTHLWNFFSGTLGDFYILLCWSGLYFGIKYYQRLQEQTEQTLKATAAAHQAQLTMLRYQLNPHFLFNTLNAISTLILDGANDTANLSVTRLSRFLRYSLDNDPMKRVTLGKELEATDLYLEIERVRFGKRLDIARDVDPAVLDALVPSLILQPLIENAIKYAVTPREEGGRIRIAATAQGDKLVLKLEDDGPGISDPVNGKTGVGLRNTRERLQQFYGHAQAFTLAPNEPTGLVITINLPLETHE